MRVDARAVIVTRENAPTRSTTGDYLRVIRDALHVLGDAAADAGYHASDLCGEAYGDGQATAYYAAAHLLDEHANHEDAR